jgi:hypothetical protein
MDPNEQNQLLTPSPDVPAERPVDDTNGGQEAADFVSEAIPQQNQRDDEGDEKDTPQPYVDHKRNEIFERARRRRAEGLSEYDGNPNDPTTLYGKDTATDELGPLEREAMRRAQGLPPQEVQQEQPEQQQPQAQQAPKKTLNGLDPALLGQKVITRVDGEDREITVEDALRAYQMNAAADRRLAEASQILQHTKEIVAKASKPESRHVDEDQGQEFSQPDDYSPQSRQTRQQNEPVNAKELIEKIQLGTPDEAADALQTIIDRQMQRVMPSDDTARVLTVLDKESAKDAILRFAQENPAIQTNDTLQAETTRMMHREMAKDLIAIGYTEADLREKLKGPEDLVELHREARITKRKGVRSPEQLLRTGYSEALTYLRSFAQALPPDPAPRQQQPRPQNQPAPALQQRQERKQSIQTQPASRRLNVQPGQVNTPRSQEQSRAAAVDRIRQARGQPTTR